eukprot:s1636_g5.t1
MKRPAGCLKRPAAAQKAVKKKPAVAELHHFCRGHVTLPATRASFREAVRAAIGSSVPEKRVEVAFSAKSRKENDSYDRFFCTSCKKDTCTFRGAALYEFATGEYVVRCTPVERHGQLDKTYGERDSLTDTQKHVIVSFLRDPDQQPFRIQRLMQHLAENFDDEAEIPDEKKVMKYVSNWRYRNQDDEMEGMQVAKKYQWTVADFRAAARSLAGVDSPEVSMALAHFSSEPDVKLIVTSPRILRVAFQRLVNCHRVHLVSDGMYRISFGDCCVITFGLAVKDSVRGRSGFATSFVELMIGFCKSEKSENFAAMLESLYSSVQCVCGIDLRGRICALHGDFNEALEKFRKQCLPGAERISDFHHLVASQRPKAGDMSQQQHEQGPPSEKTRAWRAGCMKVISQSLKNKDLAEVIEDYIYGTRCVTKACFSCLWSVLLDHLTAQQEQACVDAILSYYVDKTQHSLDATWRTGCDRVTPGLSPASQAQESWHEHRLRPGLGGKKQNSEQILRNLELFLKTRALELEREGLPCVGRTPVSEYLQAKAYVTLEVDGERYLCCRRTLYVWRDEVPQRRDSDDLGGLCEEKARHLICMATATSETDVARSLLALGAQMPLHRDPELTLRIFSRFAIVGVGPASSICYFCSPFGVHGCCEHLLLAFSVFELENFSLAFPQKPRSRRCRKKKGGGEGAVQSSSSAAPAHESAAEQEQDVEPGESLHGEGHEKAEGARLSADFVEATERHISRSLKSYQFFQDVAQKRRNSRLTRL